MPTPYLRPADQTPQKPEDICLFAQTNYRNQMRRFGIKLDDRRRHMYVIGKTGMGKTTMMENMVLSDIYRGHGVGVVDPHGDFAEKIINYIPPARINDVIYFNPADVDYPIRFNILEVRSEGQKHLVAAGLMGIFKKLWPDVWSARMEYILNNTLLALLDYPGSTLLGINRMLADKKYRKKIVRNLTDPVVKAFWQNEFANYEDRYAKEAVAPIQNKIGQFLSASVIRNMVAQVKSTVNIREAMDTRKIIIMNLSKGRIGEDNSRLLGGMLITEVQLAAMERVDMPEDQRRDFFLYVDEFQNFATPSFANILSEARKYRVSLIMAHQYVLQLDEIVANAVFGNVGTMVSFRVGGGDAELFAKEYAPTFIETDIVNLAKYQVILKLMIDGVASQPFTAQAMPPIGKPTGSSDKVIRVSRERYAQNRSAIEDKIMRWSGMDIVEGVGGDDDGDDSDDDDDDDAPAPRPSFRSGPSQRRGPPASQERKPQKQEPKREAASRPLPRPPALAPAQSPAPSAALVSVSLQALPPRGEVRREARPSGAPGASVARPASRQDFFGSSGERAGEKEGGGKKKRKRNRKRRDKGDGRGGGSDSAALLPRQQPPPSPPLPPSASVPSPAPVPAAPAPLPTHTAPRPAASPPPVSSPPVPDTDKQPSSIQAQQIVQFD